MRFNAVMARKYLIGLNDKSSCSRKKGFVSIMTFRDTLSLSEG